MGREVFLGGGCVVLGNGERASSALEPMTWNDLDVTECLREIHKNDSHLDELVRDGRANDVLTAAAKIEDAARKLGWLALAKMDK